MLPCAVLGGVLMAACQVLIYRYAPVEQTMGLVQKIFYTHLPLAWWSFVSFFLVCVSGVAYLKTRNRHWDAVAGAAAEVGVVLSGLALVSGSIWARHSWGVWWTWDPRLTTTMILWFLYAGYLVLRKMDICRRFIHDPLGFVCRIFEIPKRNIGCQRYTTLTLCFLHSPDFAACIFCEKFVKPVFDTGNIAVCAVGVDGVKMVVDGNIPHIVLWKSKVNIKPGQRGISSQSG